MNLVSLNKIDLIKYYMEHEQKQSKKETVAFKNPFKVDVFIYVY